MEDTGKLLYEEDIKGRRKQAELTSNHIGMYVSVLVLILTWILFLVGALSDVAAVWIGVGLVFALILTGMALFAIDKLGSAEAARTLPIKVYENGILMPTTAMDRILLRKHPFIRYINLGTIRLIRTQRPDKKNLLVALTKQKKRYPKQYDPNSEEPRNILDTVQKASPQVHIEIND